MKDIESTKLFGKEESVQFVQKVLSAANCQYEQEDIEKKYDDMNDGNGLSITKINKLIGTCIKPKLTLS